MPPSNDAGTIVWIDGRESVRLGEILGQPGAEGATYRVEGKPDLAIKIQIKPTSPEKLRWMMQPPSHGRARAAWPVALVSKANGSTLVHCGYAMQRAQNPVNLETLLNPASRRLVPGAHWHWLHLVAANLVDAVKLVHDRSVVFADFNPKNVLVDPATRNVTMIDLDSALIAAPGPLHQVRSGLSYPGFLAPELLLGANGKLDRTWLIHTDRTIYADSFTLGTMLFTLLTDAPPYYAVATSGTSDVHSEDDPIARGVFPYGPARPPGFGPPQIARTFESLHSALQHCFIRCFQTGYKHPHLRPSITDWKIAVDAATRDLKTCGKGHWYSTGTNYCQECHGPPAPHQRNRPHLQPPPNALPPVTQLPPDSGGLRNELEEITRSVALWTKRVVLPAAVFIALLWFVGPGGLLNASSFALGATADAGRWSISTARDVFDQEEPPKKAPARGLATLPPAIGIKTTDSPNGSNSTKVLDGDPESFWIAKHSSTTKATYIQLDLGNVKAIESIQWIIPNSGNGATVEMYVSDDGKTWTLNRTIVLQSADLDVFRTRQLRATARFVRIVFTGWKSSTIEAEVAEMRVVLRDI
jgi:serine/threonine protein kinase